MSVTSSANFEQQNLKEDALNSLCTAGVIANLIFLHTVHSNTRLVKDQGDYSKPLFSSKCVTSLPMV